jgi:hypothetical protein
MMNGSQFQFSQAAKLYATHPDIPDIIDEMRQESYRSLSEFRDALLASLAQAVKPARLGHKTTNTTGKWVGAEIQYFWAGDDTEREWKDKVPMAAIFCPLPDNAKLDERLWRYSLATISESSLKVTIALWNKNKDREAVIEVMRSLPGPDFTFESINKELIVRVRLDPGDPVGSGAAKIARLLSALRARPGSPVDISGHERPEVGPPQN